MYSSSQVMVTTLESVYGPTFAEHGLSSSLGETTRFLMVLLHLKWICMPYLPTYLLDAFTETLCVRYNNMTLCSDFISSGLGACGTPIVSPISDLPGGHIKPFLHLVQIPLRVFALGECLPEVIHFLAEKLRIATHCLGLMGEHVDNTKFS